MCYQLFAAFRKKKKMKKGLIEGKSFPELDILMRKIISYGFLMIKEVTCFFLEKYMFKLGHFRD